MLEGAIHSHVCSVYARVMPRFRTRARSARAVASSPETGESATTSDPRCAQPASRPSMSANVLASISVANATIQRSWGQIPGGETLL